MILTETAYTTLFSHLPETSRIWIYQASRLLTEQEEIHIEEKASLFIKNWESHGTKLKADFTLLHHLFLVFSVDEKQHMASGCSIDKSVHFIKGVQEELQIDFFNRTNIAYYNADLQIRTSPLSSLKQLVETGQIKNNTLIFNVLIDNLQKLRTDFLLPAEKTWISRFF